MESDCKRIKIYNATLSAINEKGIHATSISTIAKEAGVAQGTIYTYFENKQDLLNKVYLEVKEKLAKVAFEALNFDNELKSEFKLVWLKILEFKFENSMEASFLNLCDTYPIVDKKIKKQGTELLNPLVKLWEKGIREKKIKDLSPYLLYAYSIYPINFITMPETQAKCKQNKENLVNDAFEMAWNSIKVD